MFKLFVTVLAITDTGSVATSMVVTDYLDPFTCEQEARNVSIPPITKEMQGHRITLTTTASCRPANVTRTGSNEIPPPIRGMINGFIQGMGR